MGGPDVALTRREDKKRENDKRQSVALQKQGCDFRSPVFLFHASEVFVKRRVLFFGPDQIFLLCTYDGHHIDVTGERAYIEILGSGGVARKPPY
jgi:hypothetical protein